MSDHTGDDPTPRAGEGGAYRKTASQLASDPAFTTTYAPIIPGAANLNDTTTRKLRVAAARLKAGTSDFRVFAHGDSLSAGVGISAATNHWTKRLADAIAARLGVTVGNGPLSLTNSFFSQLGDTQVTLGSGWSGLSVYCAFPAAAANAPVGTSTSLDIAFTETIDGVNLAWYTGGGTTGNLIYSWDATGIGGATTVTNPGGALAVTNTFIAAPSRGTHTLHLWQAATGTKSYYWTAEPQDSQTRKVRWAATGTSGKTSTDMVGWYGSTSSQFPCADWINAANIDLHCLEIGDNDQMQVAGAVTTTTFTNNLGTVLASIQSKSSRVQTVHVGPPPPSVEPTLTPRLADFMDAAEAWGATNNVPVFRLDKRWGSYATSQPLGLYNDLIHPNATGYADMGSAIGLALSRYLA